MLALWLARGTPVRGAAALGDSTDFGSLEKRVLCDCLVCKSGFLASTIYIYTHIYKYIYIYLFIHTYGLEVPSSASHTLFQGLGLLVVG